MANLHADYYADNLRQVDAPLVRNEEIAEASFLIRVATPEIARAVVPGQFVMTRLTGIDAPLIGRALAVFDVVPDDQGRPHWIDLIYLRKGAFTTALAACPPGTMITLWGPLGNGFAPRPCDRLIMAAGGIGQTPMLVLAREAMGTQSFGDPPRPGGWAGRVELVYGARRESLLAGVAQFRAAGVDVTLCTDDGSAGVRQLVPDALAERLQTVSSNERVRVVTCGPEIMMERVAEVCRQRGVDCQVSMETPMACGIGICFTCVARVRQHGDQPWDYKRTCVEGPVFDAEQICW